MGAMVEWQGGCDGTSVGSASKCKAAQPCLLQMRHGDQHTPTHTPCMHIGSHLMPPLK